LAEGRQAGFKEALAKGDISEVVAADNERLVMQRRGFVVSALRNLERATLGLSIYLRDENGDPLRVSPESIPKEFPEPPPLRLDELDAHIIFGLRHRPELARLGAARAQNRLDLELGENLLLPEFNVNVFGAQDVGGSSSPKEELDPLKYGFGISLKVPLQRRKARGKVRQARAKLAKVGQKIRLQGDKIEAEVRDASSSFHRARERVILERRDLALAIRVEAGEREALAAGESDLLRLNLREQATARSRSKLIDAQATCLAALADYRAALGLPRPDIE
jgi:outer membrane protein TolC